MSASGIDSLLRGRDVRFQLMRLERIKKGVAIEFVVAFDTDLQGAIRHAAGHAQQEHSRC